MKQIEISDNDSGQRLDKYLLKYFNKATKSFIYKMLRKKRIKLNGGKAEGNEMLSDGDTIQMYLSEETMESFMEEKSVSDVKRTFDIVYEDENILVVNKPAGLLSHAEKKDDSNTLIDQILSYLNENGEYVPQKDSTFTPALCNRLDRNTSGIVIAGKNSDAVRQLNAAIKDKKIRKYYKTLVCGKVTEGKRLESFYEKDGNKNKAYVSDKNGGKKIITVFKPLKHTDKYSLLEIELITGKSHQIRLHLKSEGIPIIGDIKYGNAAENRAFEKIGVKRQLLHAYKTVINGMNGKLEYLNGKEIFADIPEDFKRAEKKIFGI